jgi:peptidyl-prolyl cis-trans isomerase C
MNREPVTVASRIIDPQLIAAEAQYHPASDAETAWQAAAEALVVRELLLNEARNLGLGGQPLTDGAGQTLAEEDALIETLLAEAIHTPEADEPTCRRYYDRHRDRFNQPLRVEAQHILFAAAPDDAIAQGMAYSQAREAIGILKDNPQRFAEMAAAQSACSSAEQGGMLGWIEAEQTVLPFEEALFGLPEHTLCEEPVRTRYGVHVLRSGHRSEPFLLTFEQAQPRIAQYLEEASYRRAVAQYIAVLAGAAGVCGVDLMGAEGPLVQ